MGTPLPPPPSSSSVVSASFSNFPAHISQFSAKKEAPPPPVQAPKPQPTLDQFALLCVELLLPNVPPAYESPELQAVIHAWLEQLQERASRFHGAIESTHQSIAFVVFNHEATVADSIEMALQLVLNLMEFPVVAPAVPNSALRFGLAMEVAKSRNPIAGATERTLANVNQVVMGQAVAQLVSTKRYPLTVLKSQSPLLRHGEYAGFFWDEYQLFRQHTTLVPFQSEITPLATSPSTDEDGFGDYAFTVYPENATQPAMPVYSQQLEHPVPAVNQTVLVNHGRANAPAPAQAPQPVYQPPSMPVAPSASAPRAEMGSSFQLFDQAPPHPNRTLVFPPFIVTNSVEPANTSYRQVTEHLFRGLSAGLSSQPQAPSLVVLKGIAGIGKSALLQMVRAQLEQQMTPEPSPETVEETAEEPAFLWLNAGQAHATPFPLEYWLDVLRGLFHIPTEGMPADYAGQQIDQLIQYITPESQSLKAGEVARTMKALFAVAPLPEAPLPAGTLAESLFWLLQQLVAHKPVALVLEDAEGLDETSAQVLFDLCQMGLLQLPNLVLILTTTPDCQLTPLFQQMVGKTPTLALTLAALSVEEAQEFLEAGPFLGQFNQFPAPFIQQLVAKAGATPFQLEEAVRYLVLAGQLAQHPETGALTPTQWLQVPDTVGSLPLLFQKRYEVLSPQQQQALDLASILGPRFTMSLFQALLQQPEEAFNDTLQVLWEQGWLQPDVANLIAFRHSSLHQFLRHRLVESARTERHEMVFQTLQTGFPVETASCDALLAYHATHAGLQAEALALIEAWGERLALLGCGQGHLQALWVKTQALVPRSEHDLADVLPYCQALEAIAYPLQLQDPAFFADTIAYLAYQGIQKGVFALEIAKRYEWLGLLADVMEQRFELRKALVFRQLAMACLPAHDYPNEKAILGILSLELLQKLGDWEAVQTLVETHLEPWFTQLINSGLPFPKELFSWVGQYHRLLMVYKIHTLQWPVVEQIYQRLQALLQRHQTALTGAELALVQLARARAWLWQGALVRSHSVLPATEAVVFAASQQPYEGVSPLLLEARVEWLLLQLEHTVMGAGVLTASVGQGMASKLESLKALVPELPQAQLWVALFESVDAPQAWWGLLNTLLHQQLLGLRQRFLAVGCYLQPMAGLGHDALLALLNRELPIEATSGGGALVPVVATLPYWQFVLAKGELLLVQGQLTEAGYWLQRHWKPMMQSHCLPLIVEMTLLVGRLNRLLAGATRVPQQQQYYLQQAKPLLLHARQLATKMQNLSLLERVEAALR